MLGLSHREIGVPQLLSLDLASSVEMRRTTEIGDLKTFLIFNLPGRGLKSEFGNRGIYLGLNMRRGTNIDRTKCHGVATGSREWNLGNGI